MEYLHRLLAKSENLNTLELYQETGVKIGFVPELSNFRQQSQCFLTHFKFRNDSTMAEIVESCSSHGLGLLLEITLIIFDILNISRSKIGISPVSSGLYSTYVNGTWGGAVGDILDGIYDTSLPEFTPLEARLTVIDFSHPAVQAETSFLTR